MAALESRDVQQHNPNIPRIDSRVKILYGVGDIANSVKSTLFGLFTLYFYTSVMGLPGSLVGIASAIGLAWDAVIDPYVGYLSDNSRNRFGRRHTFMLGGALAMGLSFWAFFSPPRNLTTGLLFLWLLGASIAVRTTTSVYGIPYFALGAELSQDYDERTAITATRGIFALLGTLVAASLSFVAFFPDTIPGVDPKLNYAGYPAMGLAFGLSMTLAGLVATLGTLSWRSMPAQASNHSIGRPMFFASLVRSFSTPCFRVLFFSFSLFFLAVVINSVLSIHFLTHYARVTTSTALSSFQLAFYVGGLIGMAVWMPISRRVEKHLLYRAGALATALVMSSAFLLIGEGQVLGTGNVQALLVGHAIGGFFGSILWFMPGSMLADVADLDELTTGRRREGTFFGILFFGQQLAAGVSLLSTGFLLDYFAGLVPGQAAQSSLTISRIGLLYSVLPALLIVVAAALMFRYPLGRKRLAAIQAELAQRNLTLSLEDLR